MKLLNFQFFLGGWNSNEVKKGDGVRNRDLSEMAEFCAACSGNVALFNLILGGTCRYYRSNSAVFLLLRIGVVFRSPC